MVKKGSRLGLYTWFGLRRSVSTIVAIIAINISLVQSDMISLLYAVLISVGLSALVVGLGRARTRHLASDYTLDVVASQINFRARVKNAHSAVEAVESNPSPIPNPYPSVQ